MGEWSTISYVRSTNLDHVDQAFTALCAAEGYTPAPKPPPRSTAQTGAMRYGPAPQSPLWAVALVPGADEWTMAMTAPIELLGERRPGAAQPRLADLAVLAQCDAFTVNLYDGTACILAEASAQGELACSGYPLDDEWLYHDEPLAEEYAETQFRLLAVSPALREAARLGTGAFEAIGGLVVGDRYPEEFEHEGRRWQTRWLYYNGVPEELLHFRDIPVPGTRVRFYAREGT